MGDARTGRPFCRRYALCFCKSISTEVSARNTRAAEKNIATASVTLILHLLHLNPRVPPKSQAYTAIGALIDGCGSYPTSSKSWNLKSWMFLMAGFNFNRGNGRHSRESCSRAWLNGFCKDEDRQTCERNRPAQ